MWGTFYGIVYWAMMIMVHLICMSFICPLSLFVSQILNQWHVVNSIKICSNQSNNYIKIHFKFQATLALNTLWLPLNISSEHRTSEQWHGSANFGGLYLNTVVNRWIQVNYANPLLYPFTVINCLSPGHVLLCILIVDLNSKGALLLFTLLSTSKCPFKKISVIGNRIKFS